MWPCDVLFISLFEKMQVRPRPAGRTPYGGPLLQL